MGNAYELQVGNIQSFLQFLGGYMILTAMHSASASSGLPLPWAWWVGGGYEYEHDEYEYGLTIFHDLRHVRGFSSVCKNICVVTATQFNTLPLAVSGLHHLFQHDPPPPPPHHLNLYFHDINRLPSLNAVESRRRITVIK